MPTEYEGLKFWKYEWILKLAYHSDFCRNRPGGIQRNPYSDSDWAHKHVCSFKIIYVCGSENRAK